mmetsp:Transcript_2768/g.8943  ORF Transcript_2768/g.8943 Transcript_2768/m.8943 type:complete len:352 (-) Transcript_2768:678-1733(-)
MNENENDVEKKRIKALHSELESLLRLHVHTEWVEKCFHALKDEEEEKDDEWFLSRTYDQFMFADVNVACHGSTVLEKEDLENMHEMIVKGRFVVQIDELVDVGKPFASRYENSTKNGPNLQARCLKMNATDGKRRYVLYEYSAIPQLDAVETKAGCKVALIDPKVVNGCLYVDKERLVVLGGQVTRLEAARQRMLKKWREPNRPEELTGESANRREACEKVAWGRSGGAAQNQQQREQQEQEQRRRQAPRNPPPQQQQPPRRHRQQEQHQQNRNGIIELDLDDDDNDDAPDEIEVIPNTQLDEDSMEIEVEEEEEEEDLLRCFETTPLSSRANSSSFSQQQGHNKDNNFCS